MAVSTSHPSTREPIAPPAKPAPAKLDEPYSPKEMEAFEALRDKEPNPNVLGPNVRTEDEERKFRVMSEAIAEHKRQLAEEAARPDERPTPQHRLSELKAKPPQSLGEGERIELRRLEELVADEKRMAEILAMDKTTDEEEAELRSLRLTSHAARRDGRYAEG